MGEIKHLPEAVHSCVRSGIILFDITRVVEELVFNSLDAGATKISVEVGAGTCCVKVVDNGCGITRDGLVLLGERYATSKFDQLADTDAVTRSFGFRGEALSSISDVSLLEVMTKAQGRAHGYRKVIKGCKCLYLGIDNGRQDVGTTVIARDLFYNQPVRRKHILSSKKKVLQSVKKCVHRIALIHPRVFFKVVDIDSDDELFSTTPSSSTLSQLISGFGIEVCGSLHEINAVDGVVKLSGYISSPCDTASVKAFQYVYINSRYISKGPIHKLLNQLTVKFNSLDLQKADIGSQNAKRSRSQTSVAYILNLSCPRSWYDVTFEPSMTSVEFKDWFSIISFIEKAITSFWSENFSYDPLGHGTNVLEEDNMWREAGNSSAPEEVKYEITKRRYRIRNHHDPFGLPSPQPDVQTEEIDYISCQEDSRFSCHNALDFKEQCTGFACGYQTDYSFYSCDGSLTPSNVTINRESDRHLCKDHFLGNKFLAEENYKGHADNILGSSFEDNMDASLSSVYMESTLSRDCFEIGSDEEKVSKDLKKPFMRSCSSRRSLPVDAESLVSSEGFDFQNYGLRTKRRRLRPDARFHVEEVDDIDQSSNFRQKTLRQDATASVWSSPKPITKCNRLSVDILSRDSVVTSAIGECLATESDVTQDSVVHIGQFGSTHQSFDFEWSSVISDPLFGTKSSDVERFVDENPLERGIKYDGSDRFDYLENREIKDHIFQFDDTVRNSSSQENCSLSSWTNMCSDFKSSAHSEEDGYGFLQKHNIDDVLFPKYSDICDEKEWVCLDSCGKNNGNCCAVTSHHASSSIYSNKDAKQMDQTIHREKDYVCERRPRRSHSAPPFYRGKKKFFTLSNHSTLEAGKPKIHAIADSPTSQENSELKHSQRSSGLGQLFSESNSVEDLLVYNRLDEKKAPEMSDIQKFKMQKNSEDPHIFSLNLVEDIQDPLNSELKWRNNYAKTANGDKLHDLHNEGTILDVSSGILHLAGDSLVPVSMTKNCLEDAKVLQQVDKKFIPFVGSGVLAIIDQHAADERIRLEELRHKVLSGEKKTITYLDTEQRLVLPEIGYQLLHTYAEQIQNWGWLCNIHASDSRSFKKNLNLLCKQPAVVTLVAVPCILGVNLTDGDLLEFLQQLADTDGSSAIPPSVHRVLNFKACRGAIMFGDTLLPSECSLIVEELKQTSLCFQCAHGRPTAVPLINLKALRKQIAKLESLNGGSNEFWHGLRRHEISLERAEHRLSSS